MVSEASTADVPGRRALHSAGTNRLVVPPVRLSTPSFPGCRRSNLELPTGTHRLSSHVAVLQASLDNVFTKISLLPIAL